MAILRHEVWRDADGLEMCCLAGPDGDGPRKLLGGNASLVSTFEAGSHFEALTKYNELLGRAPYTSTHAWDRTPYPDEWLQRQLAVR